MPTLKMTDAAVVRASAPPNTRVQYFDAHPRDRQRGLVLRVTAGADGRLTRTWSVLYRVKGSAKLRRITLGNYPGTKLAKARADALGIVTAASQGVDVAAQREAAARALAARERDTVAQVARDFLQEWTTRPKKRGGGMRAADTIKRITRHLDSYILPAWGGRHVGDVTRADVDRLVTNIARGEVGKQSELKGGPIAANRVLTTIKTMYGWAVKHDLTEKNPAAVVEKPGAESPRERALATDELCWLWPQLLKLRYPFGPALRLTLLTGQRPGEVTGARWSELDLEGSHLWTIPAARTKARRLHVVPLSGEALAVIEELRQYRREGADLLFTVTGKAATRVSNKVKRQLDQAINDARAEKELGPMARWTQHDLRRTAATEMSRLGTSRFVVSRVLNHADREITGVYDRHQYLAEKRAALEQWASYLRNLVTPQPKKVASLAERRAKKRRAAAS